MKRLYFIVEGQTEETFVNEVIKNYLLPFDIEVHASVVTTRRNKGRVFRGGGRNYVKYRNDIVNWMKQDQDGDAFFTSMVDLFHIPSNFPGIDSVKKDTIYKRVEALENNFQKDIEDELKDYHLYKRFIPYLQMHEFEALLFSYPDAFLYAFPNPGSRINDLKKVLEKYEQNPEFINDDNPPSYRIDDIFNNNYNKVDYGTIISLHIGIETIRSKCPHFDEWISKLEQLGKQQ